ncbi:NAD-dependent protein deacylase sirtuin-5, mitochondrial-like isoform X4 [Halichondria panicea]|uniref:NAD-dependent protein deacylase sirtuin-5, mitochondrial-like isoform X4 n=1 Tax=Halichondria panicea TaxID=6063 RepID=UPI00312B83BE
MSSKVWNSVTSVYWYVLVFTLSDLCLLVGTSSVVYPAAGFAPRLAARGVSVAEFNLEPTPVTGSLKYHFQGKCGEILPEAVKRHPSEPEQ